MHVTSSILLSVIGLVAIHHMHCVGVTLLISCGVSYPTYGYLTRRIRDLNCTCNTPGIWRVRSVLFGRLHTVRLKRKGTCRCKYPELNTTVRGCVHVLPENATRREHTLITRKKVIF